MQAAYPFCSLRQQLNVEDKVRKEYNTAAFIIWMASVENVKMSVHLQ